MLSDTRGNIPISPPSGKRTSVELLERIDHRIDRLASLIGEMEDRLEPVLFPPDPIGPSGDSVNERHAEFFEATYRKLDVLDDQLDRMTLLLQRIDL